MTFYFNVARCNNDRGSLNQNCKYRLRRRTNPRPRRRQIRVERGLTKKKHRFYAISLPSSRC
jgi:hypothetical protein